VKIQVAFGTPWTSHYTLNYYKLC